MLTRVNITSHSLAPRNIKRKIVRILIAALSLTLVTLAFLEDIHCGHWRQNLPKGTKYESEVEGIKYTGKTGNHIDDFIYYYGGWELEELHALRDCMRSIAPSKGIFLDIGANIGTHSLYMSKYSSLVLAIEPYQPVLNRLHELIKLNKFTNIRTFDVGYSDTAKVLAFYEPTTMNTGTGSFDPVFSKNKKVSGKLKLVVGDTHLAEQGINHVDIIKVDIEGFERYALMGLKNTLRKSRPVVVFELNVVEGGFQTKEKMLETFPESYQFYNLELKKPKGSGDYHVFKLGSLIYTFGPYVRGEYTLRPFDFTFKRQENLVAIPSEKAGKLLGK